MKWRLDRIHIFSRYKGYFPLCRHYFRKPDTSRQFNLFFPSIKSNFQLSSENNPRLPCLCLTFSCDCPENLPHFQPISFTAKTYHNLASCVNCNFLLAPSDIFLAIIGYCDCFSFGFKTQLKCALT